jgi:hypothetical protein
VHFLPCSARKRGSVVVLCLHSTAPVAIASRCRPAILISQKVLSTNEINFMSSNIHQTFSIPPENIPSS